MTARIELSDELAAKIGDATEATWELDPELAVHAREWIQRTIARLIADDVLIDKARLEQVEGWRHYPGACGIHKEVASCEMPQRCEPVFRLLPVREAQ